MRKHELVDIKKVSEILGVKVATVYSWVSQRRIPYIKMGRLLKFDVGQIERWITEQERPVQEF